MNSFIGIDLGTSGVKLLLVKSNGHILAEQCENYSIFHPFLYGANKIQKIGGMLLKMD